MRGINIAQKLKQSEISGIDKLRIKHEVQLFKEAYYITPKPKYLLHLFRPGELPPHKPKWIKTVTLSEPSKLPWWVQMYTIERIKYV